MASIVFKIDLRPIGELPTDEQAKIVSIRNQPGVRKNMYNSYVISKEEHLAWLQRMSHAQDSRFFAVYFNNTLIGGVSLNAINRANRRADWAFYLDEATHGKGIGPALEFAFLDYAFATEGLAKLNCEVLSSNEAVVRLHKKFGFVQEGVRRRHIQRDGETFDVILLGITREEWEARRAELKEGAFR